ncbi:MAG: hypothetical protein HFE62_06160 [Firmicutes bacterium]|nr:hypothetical protein [Bacillota bacterium]
MPGNKFMVIKLRELLKTSLFAILGVMIILAVIYFAVGKASVSTAIYVPGVYTTDVAFENGSITMAVEVDEMEIKSVELIHSSETIPVFYPHIDETAELIGQRVVKSQSAQSLEDDSVSSNVILSAIEKCLEKAKA